MTEQQKRQFARQWQLRQGYIQVTSRQRLGNALAVIIVLTLVLILAVNAIFGGK